MQSQVPNPNQNNDTTTEVVETVFKAVVIVLLFVIALVPGLVGLGVYWLYRYMEREWGVTGYWPLVPMVICVGVWFFAPFSVLFSGPGWLLHTAIHHFFATHHGHTHVHSTTGGIAPVLSIHPVNPFSSIGHSVFFKELGDAKEYVFWRMIRSALVLGVFGGSVAELMRIWKMRGVEIPTSEDRKEQWNAAQSPENHRRVVRAQKRTAKKLQRQRRDER